MFVRVYVYIFTHYKYINHIVFVYAYTVCLRVVGSLIGHGAFAKEPHTYRILFQKNPAHLRWGWPSFQQTRILSGIQIQGISSSPFLWKRTNWFVGIQTFCKKASRT